MLDLRPKRSIPISAHISGIVAFLAALLCLGLAACSGSKNGNGSDSASGERPRDTGGLRFEDADGRDGNACPGCCPTTPCGSDEACARGDVCRKRCSDHGGCGDGKCCAGLCYDEACVDTVTGSGRRGPPDAPLEQALINGVNGMAMDPQGNLLFAEWPTSGIRIVNTGAETLNGVPPNWVGRLIGHEFGCRAGDVDAARVGLPAGIDSAPDGSAYVADSHCAVIWKLSADYKRMDLFAGKPGTRGHKDGQGSNALFDQPRGVAVGPEGSVYVGDWGSDVVRRISPEGQVTTVAGVPHQPDELDGPAATARFNDPGGIAVDTDGTIYVADYAGGALRRITGQGTAEAAVDTLVRSLTKGLDACGNVAWQAIPDNPLSPSNPAHTSMSLVDGPKLYVPFYPSGIYEVAPQPDGSWLPTLWAAATGSISLTAAQEQLWTGGWVNGVAQHNTIRQRRLSDKQQVRIIGEPGRGGVTDGPAEQATLDIAGCHSGIAVDGQGNLWFTDPCRHLVRKVTPDGQVVSIGTGVMGETAGAAGVAQFCYPSAPTVVGDGVFVVSRFCGRRIQRIDVATGAVELRASICVPDKPCPQPTPNGGMVADPAGNLYVAVSQADAAGTSPVYGNSCTNTMPMIVKVPDSGAAGAVAAYFAGTENNSHDPAAHAACIDGPLGTGQFFGGTNTVTGPTGLAIDAAGNLYVADRGCGVRKVSPAGAISTLTTAVDAIGIALVLANEGPEQLYVTSSDRTVWSLSTAGSEPQRVAGDPAESAVDHFRDGRATDARFGSLGPATADANGVIYLVDLHNGRIRVLYPE